MFHAVLVCCNARSDDVTHQIIHDNFPIVRLHSAHKSHIPPAENEPSCNTLGNQIYRRGKMNRVAPASRKIGVPPSSFVNRRWSEFNKWFTISCRRCNESADHERYRRGKMNRVATLATAEKEKAIGEHTSIVQMPPERNEPSCLGCG